MEELEASSEELPAEKVEANHLVVRLKLSRTKLCNHKCSVFRNTNGADRRSKEGESYIPDERGTDM